MSPGSSYNIPKDELARKYLDEGLSIEECAEFFGCSTNPIEHRLRQYALPIRNRGNQPLEISKQELQELYVEDGLTTIDIAEKLGCHPSTVSKKLKEHAIPTNGPNHGRSILIPKDELIKLYVDEEQTTYDLAEQYDCDPTVIERRLRWFGIDNRHTSAGDGNGHYKYGNNWRKQRRKALANAGFRCELCGITDAEHRSKYKDPTRQVGLGLDVHHKVSVQSFRRWKIASIEDANALSNLQVLCQACHMEHGDRVGTTEYDS
ncbi:MAG: helix-turn-helix domain-containing protein [Halobacteriales archaeon]